MEAGPGHRPHAASAAVTARTCELGATRAHFCFFFFFFFSILSARIKVQELILFIFLK